MKTNLHLQTRREFLRRSITLASVAWTIPSFLHQTVLALDHPLGESVIVSPHDDRILVVIQLSGGNDGLNTLVPLDGRYHSLRPTIGLADDTLLSIPGTDRYGLHPSLAPMQSLITGGQVAAVASIAFPHPTRSHFTQLDDWWSATPG